MAARAVGCDMDADKMEVGQEMPAVEKSACGGGSRKSRQTMKGKEGATEGFTLSWIVFNILTPFRPDGRKCRTCNFKDSDDDPVSFAKGSDG